MNLEQFKDPVSHMCLGGTVVASWSFTQEVNSVKSFRENSNGPDSGNCQVRQKFDRFVRK